MRCWLARQPFATEHERWKGMQAGEWDWPRLLWKPYPHSAPEHISECETPGRSLSLSSSVCYGLVSSWQLKKKKPTGTPSRQTWCLFRNQSSLSCQGSHLFQYLRCQPASCLLWTSSSHQRPSCLCGPAFASLQVIHCAPEALTLVSLRGSLLCFSLSLSFIFWL